MKVYRKSSGNRFMFRIFNVFRTKRYDRINGDGLGYNAPYQSYFSVTPQNPMNQNLPWYDGDQYDYQPILLVTIGGHCALTTLSQL